MELKETEIKILNLFNKYPEIARRHLNILFPDKPKSAKYNYLAMMVNRGFIKMHYLSTATYYTLTNKGSQELKKITSI